MEIDIFAASQFRMKPGANFDQRGGPTSNRNLALGRRGNTRKNFQNRCLTGAIMADDAQSLAFLDLKTYVPERPHLRRSVRKRVLIPPPRGVARSAELIFLRYSVKLQVNRRAHITSA